MIQVVDLHKSFRDHAVLRGVNLSIARGTTTVILGGSGSGKSVLMKHMIGLLRPDRGSIVIDGEPLEGLGARELLRVRSKFGMVFQSAALFDSMTVAENVSFPLREHTKLAEGEILERVRAKLEVVGLRDIDEKYPAEISGGMRKRVGLARALALDPQIVLYDEPTTGLDPITTEYVDDMILTAKAKFGVTSVVISHDIGSAFKVADRVAVLHEGVIVAEGPTAEVRQSAHPFVKNFLALWFGRN